MVWLVGIRVKSHHTTACSCQFAKVCYLLHRYFFSTLGTRIIARNSNMLEYSSCLFATIVIHAFHLQCVLHHHAFLALTVTSILFHCQKHPVIRIVDKVLAHSVFVLVLSETPKVIVNHAEWLLIFPIACLMLWCMQTFWPERSDLLHLALHFTGICGMHCYLYVLY